MTALKKIMLAAFAVMALSGAAFAADIPSSVQSPGIGQMNGTGAARQNAWIKQFNDVCSATTMSMALSKKELRSRIRRADALKIRLDCLEESAEKVYSRRLKMCRDMYNFALEAKEKAAAGK